jgi:predicted TIM-barrel fold metal-dependent hydrolase
MVVIDADGHVEESVAMFEQLEDEYYPRRPLALGFSADTILGPNNAVWLIDGVAYPKLLGKGGVRFVTPTLMDAAKAKSSSIPAQELTDVGARLADMDGAGIDQQVVCPTLCLTTTEDVVLEAALLRAYNTFMADACAQSGGRIKFAALVPVRDLEESVRELQRAKRLGAVAVMVLGVAWDKNLGDASLRPLYEEAARLDLPVCLHFGWGCPGLTNTFDASGTFNSATLPVLMGARSVLQSSLLDEVKGLRFAFLETGSQWMPWMLHQIRRNSRGKDPAKYFRDGRAYIACEADEDINYLTTCIGEDAMVVASDYPHSDFSREDRLAEAIMAREDVPLRVREKILSDNPRHLYGM